MRQRGEGWDETITALLETIRWGQCSGKEGRSFSCRDRNSGPLRFLASDASHFKRVSTRFPVVLILERGKRRIADRDSDFRCRGCFATAVSSRELSRIE